MKDWKNWILGIVAAVITSMVGGYVDMKSELAATEVRLAALEKADGNLWHALANKRSR